MRVPGIMILGDFLAEERNAGVPLLRCFVSMAHAISWVKKKQIANLAGQALYFLIGLHIAIRDKRHCLEFCALLHCDGRESFHAVHIARLCRGPTSYPLVTVRIQKGLKVSRNQELCKRPLPSAFLCWNWFPWKGMILSSLPELLVGLRWMPARLWDGLILSSDCFTTTAPAIFKNQGNVSLQYGKEPGSQSATPFRILCLLNRPDRDSSAGLFAACRHGWSRTVWPVVIWWVPAINANSCGSRRRHTFARNENDGYPGANPFESTQSLIRQRC
jgi:hypothetical protein